MAGASSWHLRGLLGALAVSDDGSLVAAAAIGRQSGSHYGITVFDALGCVNTRTLTHEDEAFSALAFLPSSAVVVGGSYGGLLMRCNLSDPESGLSLLLRARRAISAIAIASESGKVGVLLQNSEILVVDGVCAEARARSLGKFPETRSLAMSNDGRVIAVTSVSAVALVSTHNGSVVLDRQLDWTSVEHPAFAKRGDRLAIFGWGRHGQPGTHVFTLQAGVTRIKEIAAGPQFICGAWCENDRLLVGSCYDESGVGAVAAYESTSLAECWRIRATESVIRSIAYAEQTGLAYLGTYDGFITAIRAENGRPAAT